MEAIFLQSFIAPFKQGLLLQSILLQILACWWECILQTGTTYTEIFPCNAYTDIFLQTLDFVEAILFQRTEGMCASLIQDAYKEKVSGSKVPITEDILLYECPIFATG